MNNSKLAHQNLSQSFPKHLRILSPRDFEHVFSKAEKFANRHWVFIVRPSNNPYPRLGLAIAKKQLKKAVWRNRVKRLARESFRQHTQALNGYDIVVLARRNLNEVDNEVLTQSFLHLIRKVKCSNLNTALKEKNP